MNETGFRVGVVAAAVVAGGMITRVSFCHSVALPDVPERPSPSRATLAEASASVDADPALYVEHLAADSRLYRIAPPVTPADLSKAFAHRVDAERRVLVPRKEKNRAEVLGLSLTLSVGDIEGTPRRQMILTIENTTDEYLAYRVVTRPSSGTQPCHDKSDIAQNAIAIGPGETVRRSECIYGSGWRLFVERVETIALPHLSYYYVSALPPSALGLNQLVARGHRVPGGKACRVFHSAVVGRAIESGETQWRDLLDFYARHPCSAYSFQSGYKAFESNGERPLPAVGPG